ncbi:MAG: cytochrome c [Vicinamibacterales bacterium]
MSSRTLLMLGLVGALAVPATTLAAGRQEAARGFDGGEEFRTYCAVCHGSGGRGDGPLAASMTVKPADLTAIAAANGGTFPAEDVFRTIDGRDPVKGHGGKDMPVWGDAFSRSARDSSPEDVKARIDALVRYIERLQVK